MLTKRKLKFWTNLVLIITAFPFVMLLLLMLVNPDRVSIAGKSFVEHYASLHEKQMNEAMGYLSAGNIEPVVERLDSWKEIKKGDRPYPFKRKLLNELAEYLHTEEQFEELLLWSEHWYGLDERDVTSSAFYFEALRHTQDRVAEGEEGLRTQWQRFPYNTSLVRFYAPLAVKHGNDAIAGLREKLRMLISTDWQVFWNSGNGFNTNESIWIDLAPQDNDFWTIELNFPDNVTMWRIDPPSDSDLVVSDLFMLLGETKCVVPLDQVNLHHMEKSEIALIAKGRADPYLFFNAKVCPLNEAAAAQKKVIFKFRMLSGYAAITDA